MKPLRCIILVLAAVFAPALLHPATLEGLLKGAQMEYQKSNDTYKVIVEFGGDATAIYLMEKTIGENPEVNLRLGYLYCVVLPPRDNGSYPPALYKKIAELNDNLPVGKLSLGGETGPIYFISSFWLENAEDKTLGKELAIAHTMRLELKKALAGY